jgi:hypothetical protein
MCRQNQTSYFVVEAGVEIVILFRNFAWNHLHFNVRGRKIQFWLFIKLSVTNGNVKTPLRGVDVHRLETKARTFILMNSSINELSFHFIIIGFLVSKQMIMTNHIIQHTKRFSSSAHVKTLHQMYRSFQVLIIASLHRLLLNYSDSLSALYSATWSNFSKCKSRSRMPLLYFLLNSRSTVELASFHSWTFFDQVIIYWWIFRE